MTGLEDFVGAYRGRIEAIGAEPPEPDVVDVVDRAREIDEASVPAGLRETLEQASASEGVDQPAQDLEPFAAAYGGRAARMSDERRMAAVPPPRRSRTGVRIVAATATAVAAAAALVLVFGSSVAERFSQAPGAQGLEEAERVMEPTAGDTGQVEVHEASRARRRTPQPGPATVPEEAPAQLDVESEPDARPSTSRHQRPLAELEQRAHDRWRDGDLAGAEKDLRAVIRRSGRSRRAELAYGDLFSVARQRGGASAQTRVWKQYLRRFPNGRFSDDVEAGLCRSVKSERRSRCWATYLRHHPSGAHVREATTATQAEPTTGG